jgi:hypothetical protein
MSGILINSYRYAASGFTNEYSLDFDGVDDYVDLGSATTLNFTNDFTVSAWIKETGSLNRGIFNSGDQFGAQGWLLFRASTHKASFKCAARTAISTTLVNTGDWFHLVGTWEKNAALNPHGDPGSTGNRIRIYVNGSLEGTSTRLSTNPPTYTGTIYNDIATPYNGSNEFLGNIDEVSAFNSLLSPTQISDIYNSGSPTDLTSLSPVAWYRNGDGATYPTIPDLGSGGNNGTMNNMVSGDIVAVVP